MSIVPYGFASASVRLTSPQELDFPLTRRSVSLIPDDFALCNGVPGVPTIWVEAETLVSVEGTHYTERVSILDLFPNAYVRFIAGEDTWDPIAFAWDPYVSQAITRYQLDGDPGSSPIVSNFEYQVGKEQFSVDSLSFGEDDVLTSDFNGGADDSITLTLAMAVSLKSTGSSLITFLDGANIRVVPSGLYCTIDGSHFRVRIPPGPLAHDVIYIVLDLNPPLVTVTAGYSPTKMFQGSGPLNDRTTSFTFTLTGHMELLALDMWIDSPELIHIVGGYASVFGAN